MDGTRSTFTSAGNPDHGMRLSNNTREASSSTQIAFSDGGGGVSANCDSRMAAAGYVSPTNANGPGDTVNPRLNDYFIESRLSWKKNYYEINGGSTYDVSIDKPRCWMYPFNIGAPGDPDVTPVDWDKTFWWGMSVYLPTNWESETGSNVGNYNNNRWSIAPWGSDTATRTLLHFAPWTQTSGKTQWSVIVYKNDSSINEGNGVRYDLADASTDGDLGVWTDWVFQIRFNPFTTTTDTSGISGSSGQTYNGNRGICNIWKTSGAVDGNGNRSFYQVLNLSAEPVGNVPNQFAPRVTPRIYRGGWNPGGTRDGANRPPSTINGSSADGYMFMGFDCFYLGSSADGTGFTDVNPGQLSKP